MPTTPTIERHFATSRIVHGTTITTVNRDRLIAAIRILNDLYANWTGSNTAADSLLAAYPQMPPGEVAGYLRAAQLCIDHDLAV